MGDRIVAARAKAELAQLDELSKSLAGAGEASRFDAALDKGPRAQGVAYAALRSLRRRRAADALSSIAESRGLQRPVGAWTLAAAPA